MTLVISHPETLSVKIPFVKKNETDLPKLKLTYFNTSTEKNEDFLKCDYIGHLEKFGFEWAINEKNFDFKYEIKIDSSDNIKLIKKIYLSKYARNLLQNDESRIWNMLPTWIENHWSTDRSRIFFLKGYLYDEQKVINYFKIRDSFDFKRLTVIKKTFLGWAYKWSIKKSSSSRFW